MNRFDEDLRRGGLRIIARGATRLCALDPDSAAHCLKFELPAEARGRPSLRQRARRALARYWPYFGENRLELRAWRHLRQRHGDGIEAHFAACEGIVQTHWGSALRCRCARLPNGQPARSLYAQLFDGAPEHSADALCAAVDEFERFLLQRHIPLFDLNAGNFVVIPEGNGARLFCVDAKSVLGGKEFLPLSRYFPVLLRRKIARRAQRLRQRIREALAADPALAPPLAGH